MLWRLFFVLQELDSQIDRLREELHLGTLLGGARTAHLGSEIERARRDAEVIRAQLRFREEQRADAAALIAGRFLAHYERLRVQLRTRPWVVDLSGAACPACNFVLPSKMIGETQRTRDPMPCPSCTRLLIWREMDVGG